MRLLTSVPENVCTNRGTFAGWTRGPMSLKRNDMYQNVWTTCVNFSWPMLK